MTIELLYGIGLKVKAKNIFREVFVWNDVLMGIGNADVEIRTAEPRDTRSGDFSEIFSLVTAWANKMDPRIIIFDFHNSRISDLDELRKDCKADAVSIYELYEENFRDAPGQKALFWMNPIPFEQTPQFFREGVIVDRAYPLT